MALMTAFFVRTDVGAAGPFTGVEIREAALAGLLTPETVLSNSPTGPWTAAYQAGLFSEKRVPLPHPEGVVVPVFHVKGLPPSFSGPFKLRELIGFAARGLLPAGVLLRADSQTTWLAVDRIRILEATLRGDLALIDHQGNVIRRAGRSSTVGQGERIHQAEAIRQPLFARAPIELARSAVHDVGSQQEALQGDAPNHCAVAESESKAAVAVAATVARPATADAKPIATVGRSFHVELSPTVLKRLFQVAAIVVVFAILGYAYSSRRAPAMEVQRAVGEWFVGDASGDGDGNGSVSRCGVALRPEGTCVVFNAESPCWSGRYQWLERTDDDRGLRGIEAIIEVETASRHHQVSPVLPTDGYLRFVGEGDVLPIIDGHLISDAFVRRDGERLSLGYLVSIEIGAESKQLNAAWIPMNKLVHQSPSEEMTSMTTERMPDALNLLTAYGVPDEARPLHPYEIPVDKMADRYEDAQLIRYGPSRFALSSSQAWQPVTSRYPASSR